MTAGADNFNQPKMNTPTPKVYEGTSGGLKKPSPWLSSEDLADREARVVIEAVEIYDEIEFEAGRSERNVGALKFVGKDKRLVLNATNRKFLVNLYGMATKDWLGKAVVLFVNFKVKGMGGKIVAGLRMKTAPDSVRNISKPESMASEVGQ